MKREIQNATHRMSQFCNGLPVLAGSIRGKQVFGALAVETVPPVVPTICTLDFAGIDIATGSFLRESVYAYRTHARSQWPFLYPIIANANESVLEELALCLATKADAMIAVNMTETGDITNPVLVGQIEGKQREALRLVVDRRSVEAPLLAKELGELPTTWNNRLAALAAKGLVLEDSFGRGKRYVPVVEGLRYGP